MDCLVHFLCQKLVYGNSCNLSGVQRDRLIFYLLQKLDTDQYLSDLLEKRRSLKCDVLSSQTL